MKLQEIRTLARQHQIKTDGLSKADLIRRVQLQEGNFDCFASAVHNECDQQGCLWRNDCLPFAAK